MQETDVINRLNRGRVILSCPSCFAVYAKPSPRCMLDGTPLVSKPGHPLVGVDFQGYEILASLGSGGMATVYRGRHKEEGIEFAIKIPYGEMAANPSISKRFQREAQALSTISHPNVVKVREYGFSKEKLPFMVMELLPGRPLVELCAHPISTENVLEIARQTTRGLAAIHDAGFFHRDIKSANIVVEETSAGPSVKILDLGLVLAIDEDSLDTRLTRAGHMHGTPSYMPPEVIRGDTFTQASDLYSLGAVFYEMLSGAPPFQGTFPEVINQHVHEKPKPLIGDGPLPALCLQMLAKAQKDRPASCAEVLQRLDNPTDVLSPMQLFSIAPDEPPPGRAWGPKAVVASAAALAAAGLFFVLGHERHPGQTQAPPIPIEPAPTAEPTPDEPALAPVAAPELVPVPEPALVAPPPANPEPTAKPTSRREARRASRRGATRTGPAEIVEVTVTSEPSGALVTSGRGSLGRTPLTVPLAQGAPFSVTLRLEGYSDRAMKLRPTERRRAFHAKLERAR